MYLPTSEFNLNVKENKKNHPVLFLMKRDPSLPFGDIELQVLFRELADHEHYYGANDLEFDDDASPTVLDITVPESPTDELLQASTPNEQAEQ
jgi:hypothetical protein